MNTIQIKARIEILEDAFNTLSTEVNGYASATIVKHKYPHANLIGFDYGQQIGLTYLP